MSTDEQVKQRIEQDKQQINKLLTDLEDKSEDKPLRRSHNSVNISFAQMLAYIDKIISESMMPEDIRLSLPDKISGSVMSEDIKRLVIDKISGSVMPKDDKNLLTEKIRLKQLLGILDSESLRKSDQSVVKFFTDMPNEIDKINSWGELPPDDSRYLLTDKIQMADMPNDIASLLIDKIFESVMPEDMKELLTDKILKADMPKDITYLLIDKIRRAAMPEDITYLLKTYREMAEKFYTQYELSLLAEIKRQSDLQIQSNEVMEYIGKLADNDPKKEKLKRAIPLLENARDDAAAEFNKLIKNFPTLLQNALDKLKDEWQRLDTIAVASKTLTEDENLIRTLQVVVFSAALSVGIEAERIAIVPGDAFALYFFTYLENFAVLTVPIYSVQAPWEWSIFWHELAGYKVRQLEKDTALTTVRENLERLHNLFKTLDETGYSKADLLPSISPNNPFGLKYISNLFSSEDKLDLSDLGSFEHQFERMLANLPIENKFQNYEQIKADGWCVDWFKELFEDAWSILAIGEGFLVYFEDILSRHDATDGRHPPLEVRLSVAKELLKLANLESKVENQPKLVEIIAAEQILKFMSLIIMASSCTSYTFEKLEELMTLLWFDRGMIGDFVGKKLKAAISDWSTEFLATDGSAGKAKDYAKIFIEDFSKDPDIYKLIQRIEKEIVASYENLLEGLDYKQLLALSFFERDFLSGDPDIVAEFKAKVKGVEHTYVFKSTDVANEISNKTFSSLDTKPDVPSGGAVFALKIDGNDTTGRVSNKKGKTRWISINSTTLTNLISKGKITIKP